MYIWHEKQPVGRTEQDFYFKLLMKTSLIIITLLLAQMSFAQKQTKNKGPQDLMLKTDISKKHPVGTFQIINSVNQNEKVLITSELLNEIEMKRMQSVNTFLVISENIKIEIFSKDAISAPNFDPYN